MILKGGSVSSGATEDSLVGGGGGGGGGNEGEGPKCACSKVNSGFLLFELKLTIVSLFSLHIPDLTSGV